jgi:hypothetical protein
MGRVEFSVTERRLTVARGPVTQSAAELQCVRCLCHGVEVGFEFSQLERVAGFVTPAGNDLRALLGERRQRWRDRTR